LSRITLLTALAFLLGATAVLPNTARSATAGEIDRNARAGLRRRCAYASSPSVQAGGQRTKAILVFPIIVTARFMVGTQGRETKSGGWELGTGPSIVVVDTGMAKSLTTTTPQRNVHAFFFGQKGLMAGPGLQASKITRCVACE
jgi:hypothetical protein